MLDDVVMVFRIGIFIGLKDFKTAYTACADSVDSMAA
jgi:hypothetical protein